MSGTLKLKVSVNICRCAEWSMREGGTCDISLDYQITVTTLQQQLHNT